MSNFKAFQLDLCHKSVRGGFGAQTTTEGQQQGALRDRNDRDSLKWVGLLLCVSLRAAPWDRTSHMDISENDTESTVAPSPWRCNLRAALAACQADEVLPLVQTGSQRDP